jgi:membrane associated rhomboid family serine protease
MPAKKKQEKKYDFLKKGNLPKLPLATLYLFSTILLVYYVSVNFFPFFSPNYDILSNLGLHFNAPWSIFTHMFIHLWPSHLFVDCLLLLIFGAIVERKVGAWKTLTIFIVSGLLGGLVNLLFFPTKILIGSSGAVFGLIGAAIVLHPFFSFGLFVVSLNLLAPAVTKTVDSVESVVVEKISSERQSLAYFEEALQDKIGKLSTQRAELNLTVSAGKTELEAQESALSDLQASYQAGKITQAEFEKISAQIISRISSIRENLTRNAQVMTLVNRDLLQAHQDRLQVATERVGVEEKTAQFDYSQKTRDSTPQANWPHSIGLIIGAIALFILRPETFLEWEKKYDVISNFVFRKRG